MANSIQYEHNTFNKLIEKFHTLPQNDREPSFMEICSYPYNRFEEICSRVLKFFLSPDAEHGMGYLWLVSLIEAVKSRLISKDCKSGMYKDLQDTLYDKNFSIGKVDIRLEEHAESKRIDLIIECASCVICIENKITAELYNPLDIYSVHLEKKYPDKTKIKILLSLSPITSPKIYKKLNDNGFISILYCSLFDYVKQYSGNFLGKVKYNYLLYMYDFMKTLENKDNIITKQEREFFHNYADEIEAIVVRRNKYNDLVLNEQKEQITILQESMGNGWEVWEGWVLSTSFCNDDRRIGIDSFYEATSESSCGKFRICITTWCKDAWLPYKKKLVEMFPDCELNENAGENNNRVFLYMPTIYGNDHDKIVMVLKDVYENLKSVVDSVNAQI